MNRYLSIVRQRAEELRIAAESNDNSAAETSETPVSPTIGGKVTLGDNTFDYSVWDGKPLSGELIAVDTETSLIQEHEIPDLAMVSVSDGDKHHLVHPNQFAEFLRAHKGCHFVAHNAPFDFWVVEQHLRARGESGSVDQWWAVVDQSRLHDTMYLDALIRLAQTDADPRAVRDLAVVSREYRGLMLDKSDPYRLRYAEILNKDWGTVDPGFLDYAIKDAIATILVFLQMVRIARQLLEDHRSCLLEGANRRFGLLTEALQVQGAIALAAIERNGLRIDRDQAGEMQQRIHQQMEESTKAIESMAVAEGLFKRTKSGALRLAPKSHAPSIDKKRLASILEHLALASGESFDIPRTVKTNSIVTSVKFWAQHCDLHPFISAWVELTNLSKLSQFVENVSADRIHPRYSPLVRTGRTSCFSPNIQQLPRAAGFREMVIPSAGHYLLTVDYAFIELRTLAAICEHRYGSSVLAQVIKDGTDPHAYTAALFEGMQLAEFMALKDANPDRFKRLRQQAKALNFGIPGGLGAESLVDYAASTYGVELSLEDAQGFRERLIEEVYPEIGRYLREDSPTNLAHNLGADAAIVRSCFQSAKAIRNVVRGQPCKSDGTPYDKTWYDRTWDKLIGLNKNPDLQELLAARQGSEELHGRLFWGPVTTLTGRLRGRVSFSQARNTPFQGLAADGAKRALWKLTMAGYRCAAFIHDEVLIELPTDADHAAEARRIDEIMCAAMQEFTGTVPVACEYALATRWCKQAEAVYDEQGRLIPWKSVD